MDENNWWSWASCLVLSCQSFGDYISIWLWWMFLHCVLKTNEYIIGFKFWVNNNYNKMDAWLVSHTNIHTYTNTHTHTHPDILYGSCQPLKHILSLMAIIIIIIKWKPPPTVEPDIFFLVVVVGYNIPDIQRSYLVLIFFLHTIMWYI